MPEDQDVHYWVGDARDGTAPRTHVLCTFMDHDKPLPAEVNVTTVKADVDCKDCLNYIKR